MWLGQKRKQTFSTRISRLLKPQAANRYRSEILHPKTLLVMILLVLAVFSLINAVRFFPSLADRVLGYSSNIDVNTLLSEVNARRQELGLSQVVLSEQLNQAALAKAQDMFSDQYWAHVAPDGKQAWDFIKEASYSYKYAGENLARDFDTSTQVVQAWMDSPSHRENMVNPDFTNMGLAVVNGNLKGFNTTLVVQLFAVPQAAQIKSANHQTINLPKAAEPNFSEGGLVAGQRNTSSELIFSPLNVTRAVFLVIVMLIVLTLIYDALVAKNHKYSRLAGENFAHVAVFVTIAFLLILFKGGMVLP
jgi:hypothetical protein